METNVKAIELKDLWRRYKSTGDEQARERLVVAYSPLVKYVAGRMASGLPAHVRRNAQLGVGRWLAETPGAIHTVDRRFALRDTAQAHLAVEAKTKVGTVVVLCESTGTNA